MNQRTAPIRVLIVDDSTSYRDLLQTILEDTPDMKVVGLAHDGVEGVDLAQTLKPDVITMDVHMPNMDGFEATRQIMASQPCPIVMISANVSQSERDLTFEALRAGALSIINKPTLLESSDKLARLVSQVRLMSQVKVVRRWNATKRQQRATHPIKTEPTQPIIHPKIVAIASSTGGPGLLADILKQLPATFSVPIVIVQHITPGFGTGLAAWLDQQTPLTVQLAQSEERLKAGHVAIAPDDYHLTVNRLGVVSLNQQLPLHGVRPAADYLFQSVKEAYNGQAIGVILTGMGRDGAKGLLSLKQAGGYTIAQDKDSCVVFGMPAAAIELGAVRAILSGRKIARALEKLADQGWNPR